MGENSEGGQEEFPEITKNIKGAKIEGFRKNDPQMESQKKSLLV